jgi:hypothetical protein
MRFSGLDMQAVLTATTIYLDAPYADAAHDALSRTEMEAAVTARTILAMARDSLGQPPILAREADIGFTPEELRVLRRAVSACLDSGVTIAGLPMAHAKLVRAD